MRYYVENRSNGVLEIVEAVTPASALEKYANGCIMPTTAAALQMKGYVVRELRVLGGKSMTGADMITPGSVVHPK